MGPRLRSKSEAAEALGISVRTVDRLVRDGELGYVRIGGRILFSLGQIQSYVAGRSVGPRP